MNVQVGPGREHGIPLPRTRLIGREREIQDVLALVDDPDVPIITLTGPGGIGKTRIALQVAHLLDGRGDSDVVFIDLTAISDPAHVMPAIAHRLGVRANEQHTLLDQLIAALGTGHLLLVLDNFEQVMNAAKDIRHLVDTCPSLTLLITSRSRLQLDGEREYRVESLPTPTGIHLSSTEYLAGFDSVKLFVQRAKWAEPGFELTPDATRAVAEICVQLDGLPLAIELAASRSHVLSPTAMRSRLEHRLPLLTGGSLDLPARQQTMQRTITWSYDLLPVPEQRFFRAMTVFTDGFSFEAAEAIARTLFGETADALASLSSLIDKSFLRTTVGMDREPRYRMLETIREFGLGEVTSNNEEATLRNAHADFFLRFAHDVAQAFRPVIQLPAIDRLEADYANIRAALTWLQATERHDEVRQLTVSLRRFWFLGGHEREGLAWLNRAIDPGPGPADAAHAEALLAAAELSQRLHEPDARTYLTRMFRIGPPRLDLHADGIQLLGIMAEDSGDYDQAEELLTSSRVLYERLGEPWYPLVVDYHLGIQAYGKGDLEKARALMETAMSAAQSLGDVLVPAWCSLFLALIACEQGSPIDAAAMLRRLQRPVSDTRLPSLHVHHHPMHLSSVAVLAATIGEWSAAARLFGAANADHRATVIAMPEAATFERAQGNIRGHLPIQDYDDAWNAGRTLHPQDIWEQVNCVLATADSGPVSRPGAAGTSLLTPREMDVLRLLTTGQSNQQIADALFLSPGTVKIHVSHILAKLGLSSRAAAADYAHRHHLV